MKPLSEAALLVGFLMIWLKKCVEPSPPYEVIFATVALPAVQLAGSHPVALLPALIGNLQYGLYQQVAEFMKGMANPHVDLPE